MDSKSIILGAQLDRLGHLIVLQANKRGYQENGVTYTVFRAWLVRSRRGVFHVATVLGFFLDQQRLFTRAIHDF